MNFIKFFFISIFFKFCVVISAQNFSNYSVQNAHSHNDYHQENYFWEAYNAGFGSIEADVFLVNNQLLVAHAKNETNPERTLEKMYLNPLSEIITKNNYLYKNPKNHLYLMIDIKEDHKTLLPALIDLLNKRPELIQNSQLKFVISGDRPEPKDFKNYPDYIYFDGFFDKSYSAEELKRVAFFSGNLQDFTKWRGKGIPKDEETAKIKSTVERVHKLNKPIRFWAAPDFTNAWINLINLNVDIINTDQIFKLSEFLNNIPKTFYKNDKEYKSYTPNYKSDGIKKKAKNVILLISDGASLAQYYAAFTANKGNLNIIKMKSSGLSKTNSFNAYITDSAPGSTSFATGVKTKNNFVGVDAEGKRLSQIPEIIAKKGLVTGLISTGDITDATPADFYAHTIDRDNSSTIIKNFADSSVKILLGGPTDGLTAENLELLKSKNIKTYPSLKQVDLKDDRILVSDPLASEKFLGKREKWLGEAFDLTLNKLKQNKDGFFIMAEASRTDIAGHNNDLPYVVSEMLDFDEVVGKALKFADEKGETLVVVLGDHETGGLTILDGNIKEGWVFGNFSTNDHTALPATVFAYGPNSKDFTGFYENTEIFNKILKAFGFD